MKKIANIISDIANNVFIKKVVIITLFHSCLNKNLFEKVKIIALIRTRQKLSVNKNKIVVISVKRKYTVYTSFLFTINRVAIILEAAKN